MPFSADDLIQGREQPVTIQANASVRGALEIMIENDFSQLPIVDDHRFPQGIVSSNSILRGIVNFREF